MRARRDSAMQFPRTQAAIGRIFSEKQGAWGIPSCRGSQRRAPVPLPNAAALVHASRATTSGSCAFHPDREAAPPVAPSDQPKLTDSGRLRTSTYVGQHCPRRRCRRALQVEPCPMRPVLASSRASGDSGDQRVVLLDSRAHFRIDSGTDHFLHSHPSSLMKVSVSL